MPVTSDEIINTLKTMSAREACDKAGVTLESLIRKGKKELLANKSDKADWPVRQKARSLFHDIRQDKPPTNVKLDLPKGHVTFIMNMSGEEPPPKLAKRTKVFVAPADLDRGDSNVHVRKARKGGTRPKPKKRSQNNAKSDNQKRQG